MCRLQRDQPQGQWRRGEVVGAGCTSKLELMEFDDGFDVGQEIRERNPDDS